MQLLLEIGQIVVASFMFALFMPLLWIVILLAFFQYRRQVILEKRFFGRPINSMGRQILTSLALGIPGGFFASAIMIILGISLDQIGLYFIWPVALLLLLINPRYLCFSYAGGIVALAVLVVRHLIIPIKPDLGGNIVAGALLDIHIPALLVLIGLLHLVEALLIVVGGHLGSSPVYIREKNGKVIGAFSLQRLWPIPLVALLVSLVAQSDLAGVSMPGWWPIIESTLKPGVGESLQYALIPVAAGLGYADLARSSRPREKSQSSGKWLSIYSIILLGIAISSEFVSWLAIPGVLFAPLAHELLIFQSNNMEEKKKPLYLAPEKGVLVMMVLAGTAAEEAGLADGDLILRVNGRDINDAGDMTSSIEESYFLVLIEGLRNGTPFSLVLKKRPHLNSEEKEAGPSGGDAESIYQMLHSCRTFGYIPAPDPRSPFYLEIRKSNLAGKLGLLKDKMLRLLKIN